MRNMARLKPGFIPRGVGGPRTGDPEQISWENVEGRMRHTFSKLKYDGIREFSRVTGHAAEPRPGVGNWSRLKTRPGFRGNFDIRLDVEDHTIFRLRDSGEVSDKFGALSDAL